MSNNPPKFKLAICGGGIAGLILAIALHKYAPQGSPIQIDIYEADPEVRTVGAGITIWPRTWTVMRHLDLHEQLSQMTVQRSGAPEEQYDARLKPAFVARKANQPSEGYTYARVLAPSGSTTMHRKDMINVFLHNLPPNCTLHTSKRRVEYARDEQSSLITLHFADGTTAETDILIGADGIHSATRMCMYAAAHMKDCLVGSPEKDASQHMCLRCKAATPVWIGTHSYRCLIPTAKLYAMNPNHTTASIRAILCYSGKGKHIITYQISGGNFLNFVAICRTPGGEGSPYSGSWVTQVPREEVVSQFDGWEPEVQQMVDCVDNPSRWAIHVVDSLPFSVSGNVALIGDAMHAMSPNFGAGGGQAIEDAYILGRLLADPRVTRAHVPAVLHIYERIRLPFATNVARDGREVGLMYEFNAPGHYDDSAPAMGQENGTLEDYKGSLDELGDAIHKMWEWQWTEDSNDLWLQAEKELETLFGDQLV